MQDKNIRIFDEQIKMRFMRVKVSKLVIVDSIASHDDDANEQTKKTHNCLSQKT